MGECLMRFIYKKVCVTIGMIEQQFNRVISEGSE